MHQPTEGDEDRPGHAGPRRRTILIGTAVAATVSTLALVDHRTNGGSDEACAAPTRSNAASTPLTVEDTAGSTVDPHQRFLGFVGIGDGQIVAIQADGALLWYRNAAWASGGSAWANGGRGQVIGRGWADYTAVLGSADGSLYAVRGDGQLFHHEFLGSDMKTGAGNWSEPRLIDTGWHRYREVIGFGGDFYGRRADGSVHWSHYDQQARRWTSQDLRLQGFDFSGAALYADADGVLYASSGPLRWYRHINGVWQRGSHSVIHASFGDLYINGLYATGAGTFYGIETDAPGTAPIARVVAVRLTNYRDAGKRPTWTNCGSGNDVGRGWSVEPHAALQGYPVNPSVVAGQSVQIAISSTFPSFEWSVLRLGGPEPTPVAPAQAGTARGGLQLLPGNDFLATGCDWRPKVSVDTAGFESGLYAVRLHGPHGMARDIPFIVNPAPHAKKADIAFLVPTLTHHAYNTWGGHDQYCHDLNGHQRRLNLARPSRQKPTGPTGRLEHTLYSDIMLLHWLYSQGYRVDVYDDMDLHRDPGLFAGYRVAVLGSHPEYFSLTMRQGLYTHLYNSGNLVYAGGNGVFEAVSIDADSGLVTFRVSAKEAARLSSASGSTIRPGGRRLMSYLGYPGSQLLAVAYKGVVTAHAGFKVVADASHPLLAGTGLTKGSRFGERGYNGGASGWETDGLKSGWPGVATRAEVIARGMNAKKLGADIVYHPTGHGGHVFSASSISFVGALAVDPAQSRLFRNAFDAMLTGPAPQGSQDHHGDGRAEHQMPRVAPIVPASRDD